MAWMHPRPTSVWTLVISLGQLTVSWCCTPDDQCGVIMDILDLGCVENSMASALTSDSNLTARACGG